MKHRKSSRLIAVLASVSLIAAACGGDDDSSSETPATTVAPDTGDDGDDSGDDSGDDAAPAPSGEGGTLVWAHEQEPPDLHLDDPENNLSITSWIRQSMWDGLYGVSSANEFIPELLAGEADVTENADGTVTASFVLRDGLTWSDGEALTSDDVKYTYEMIMATDADGEFVYLTGDRTGLDSIIDFTVISDTEFTITWSEFFAGWKAILAEIHPSHIFPADPAEAAAAENEALRDWTYEGATLPSSGPMIFDSWQKGIQMNLVRNDSYHGSTSPDVVRQGETASVAGVQINFVTDTDAQINALLAGEAQIVMTQPQLAFEQLADSADFTVNAAAGPVFEHWGLNLYNVHLIKPAVREALAYAMDKTEVMAGLYTPLFGDLLPAEGLGNVYWLSNQSAYVDHAGDAGYGAGNVDAAAAALESEGYSLNADGIYEHPEDGVLTLRVGTTGGNRLREIQQELIQAQMKDAGIDIVIDNVDGGAYFNAQPFNEDALACATSGGTEGVCDVWDITQFAWVGGPWPGGQSASFRSGAGNNPYGYNNAEFDAKANECDAIVDDANRADCYNELNRYVSTLDVDSETGLFMLPLTQKPSFFGYTSQLSQGAEAPDANSAGPLVYVVDYVFAS